MEKAASSGQFRNLIGNLNMSPETNINQIKGEYIQKAIDGCGSGITQSEFVKWINNGCCLNTVLVNAFTVGDVFRHRAEDGDRRLYLGDNFQNWIIKSNLKKIIPIRTDISKISEYKLSKNMNDTTIQEKAGNPGSMDLETFLCVLYLLIFQPALAKELLGYSLEKNKYYLFHVEIDGKRVACSLDWDGEWYLNAYKFDNDNWWDEVCVFLFPATKAVAKS